MEQSNHTIPRVFSLMQMVSHPWSLAEQSKHTISRNLFINEDGVPSWSIPEQFKHSSRNLLLMRVVSHPGHGTRNCKRSSGDFSQHLCFHKCAKAGATRSWSRHQKLQEGNSSISLYQFSSLLLNWPVLEICNV